MKRGIGILMLLLVTGILCRSAYAESGPFAVRPWEKFGLNAGVFLAAIDSSLRIGTDGIGVDIDVEELLGLDSEQFVFRVDTLWRFSQNRRHRLDFSWFSYNRDSTKRVGNDFDIQRPDGSVVTISAGTTVNSSFDLDIYKGVYSYSFFQDDRVDLAISLGLYVMPIDAGLRTAGAIDASEAATFTAPLPVLGLRADFAITPRWILRFGSELFYLEYDDFKGSLVNASTRLEYNPWKHVGFGLRVESFRLNIEAEGDDYPGIDFRGNVEFYYAGVELYTRIFF